MKIPFQRSVVHCSGGFSLIEILIVVAVIGILVALSFPAVGKIKEGALKVKDANNLQQQAKLVFAYANDHDNTLPGRINRGIAIPSTVTVDSKRILYLSTVLIDGGYCGKEDGIWRCPADYGANEAGVAYVVNSGLKSSPKYFFGNRSSTAGATTYPPQKLPAIKANISATNDPAYGKEQEPMSQIWMISNADGDNYNSTATTGLANSIADSVHTPWGGRNYVFFDGHMEFVKRGTYPYILADTAN